MSMRTIAVDGKRYKISLPHEGSDYIQGSIAQTGEPYELEMLRNMASYLQPCDLVLDIGANIGNHSLYLAAVTGAKVEAFDPNAELCQGLLESIEANDLQDRLKVHQVGVSDRKGFAKFSNLDSSNLGGQSLTVTGDDNTEIKLIRLDDLQFEAPIRIIKIDVEGMELAVLRGAKNLLKKYQPLLYIEAQSVEGFRSQINLLKDYGYHYFATFNATPTHLYVHNNKKMTKDKLADALINKQFNAYKEHEAFLGLRAKYQELNATYNELKIKNTDLLVKHEKANLKYREVMRHTVPNLKCQIENLNQYRAELLDRVQCLGIELGQSKEECRGLSVLKVKLEKQIDRTNELYERANKLNEQLKIEKEKRHNTERELKNIKHSKTWKSGVYLQRSSRSIIEALKLPLRLIRLRNSITQENLGKIVSSPVTTGDLRSLSKTQEETATVQNARVAVLNRKILKEKLNHEIRIACIMDEFTYGSFAPEAQLTQLTPSDWKSELEDCQPDLLFVESAWRGKDELWGSRVGHCSVEVKSIVNWCRDKNIPTIFWNKEDPVHFETFLTTAKQFDYVFTTDIDRVHRYKETLGHNRIYFMPFACQPLTHNPIEKYERKDAFCFAGAYYVKYPERTKDLESFVSELPDFKPLEIYDRNYGKEHPDYKFPESYQPYIKGTLSFDEIDKAYKGYNYAINLNSIKQSQSMFARRVYELLGSNTLTISNFSRGLRLLFGDLVLTSDSGSEIKRRMKVLQEKGAIDRVRLAGLRKVMSEHTYEDRLNYILEKVTEEERVFALPDVHVVAKFDTIEQLKLLVDNLIRQRGIKLSATLVSNSEHIKQRATSLIAPDLGSLIRIINQSEVDNLNLNKIPLVSTSWVAGMSPEDYYGPNYLYDILLATRYSKAKIIGKAAWYEKKHSELKLNKSEMIYQPVPSLAARRSVISPDISKAISAKDWLHSIENYHYSQMDQFAVDCYNYCEQLIDYNQEQLELVNDISLDCGFELNRLLLEAESVAPHQSDAGEAAILSGRDFALLLRGEDFHFSSALSMAEIDLDAVDENIRLSRNSKLNASIIGSAFGLVSELDDGKHEYIYAPKLISRESLLSVNEQLDNNTIKVHFATEPGLNLNLVILFFDAKENRLGHQMVLPNINANIELPDEAIYIRLGLRVYAGGSAKIKGIAFGHLDLDPNYIQTRSNILLLTNHYPSYSDLYRNGFVHSRVRSYNEKNVNVDVFKIRKNSYIRWEEYQNVDVTTGSQEALHKLLKTGSYKHILVHFLDSDMWSVLEDYIDEIKVTVWVHGSEVQPWWRREYNYEANSPELEAAKVESSIRLEFWKELFAANHKNLKLIFVSDYFANEVIEDVNIELNRENYEIIHNPIDTDIFNYIEKDSEQRLKILSIRPYASRKYANDLSVQTVLELSKEPFFKELEFRFIGDGVLFDETLEPIRKFENVTIEKGFLSQAEIAHLHKEYGVFLCPTRMDAQGVSKDEAMSSGLVVISNAVTAIPEFIDNNSGMLSPGEDYIDMANNLKSLYLEPELFMKLSKNAALRVRRQTDKKTIIEKELNLFL